MAGPAGSAANTNPTDKTPFHGLNMNTLCKSKNSRDPFATLVAKGT
jgi:hypothetical protein